MEHHLVVEDLAAHSRTKVGRTGGGPPGRVLWPPARNIIEFEDNLIIA